MHTFMTEIHNPMTLSTPSEEFSLAYALISTSKSWKKWSKPISKKVYDQICEEAREAIAAFGLQDRYHTGFIRNVIDRYLDHGALKAGSCRYAWEVGLFAVFKRRIDAAVRRRYRAMLAAAKRKPFRSALKAKVELSAEAQPQACAYDRPEPSKEPKSSDRRERSSCSESAVHSENLSHSASLKLSASPNYSDHSESLSRFEWHKDAVSQEDTMRQSPAAMTATTDVGRKLGKLRTRGKAIRCPGL